MKKFPPNAHLIIRIKDDHLMQASIPIHKEITDKNPEIELLNIGNDPTQESYLASKFLNLELVMELQNAESQILKDFNFDLDLMKVTTVKMTHLLQIS